MEEQKSNGKVVSMSTDNTQKESQEKLSYEELTKIAIELQKRNEYLEPQLRRALAELRAVERLDYLFKVVEISSKRTNDTYNFTPDFVLKCLEEIEKIMTIPEEPEQNANKEN